MAKRNTTESQGDPPTQLSRALTDPSENVKSELRQAMKRQDDLRGQEAHYIRSMMRMSVKHNAELRRAETKRINAIRAVDVGAVTRASEVSTLQAQTLATQVATSAETLRGQVAAAATATAAALTTALTPIIQAVEDLRKAQYQQQGERVQRTEGTGNYRWLIGTGIAVGGCLIAFVVALLTAISLVVSLVYLHTQHVI